MRIYVAAPYSQGDTMLNVRAAIEAAEALMAKGHTPFVPHLSALWQLVAPHSNDFWYRYGMEWLEVCNAVLRLPGPSVGADFEVRVAEAQGKPVYYSLANVPDMRVIDESTTAD